MLIFRDHGQGNSRENAVTKSETQISELRSCFFSQDSLKFHQGMLHENMARRQPSVSPFVNVYLYLVGNGAPPKAQHMVSSEAQNKNISPICTPTWFCLPISTLMKADYFNLTLKKKSLKTVFQIYFQFCLYKVFDQKKYFQRESHLLLGYYPRHRSLG